MKLRAKFEVKSKTQETSGWKVTLGVVTNGSEENKEFFHYTPFGSIEMGFLNVATADALAVGQEYYVDFTPAAEKDEE